MYKKILLVVLNLIVYFSNAQIHRFFYELEFKKDSASDNYDKDFYILDVETNQQKFYNYEFYKNDSIQKAENNGYIFSYPKLEIRLIHQQNNTFNNYFIESPTYYVQKTNDKQIWNITKEKKKIGNYNVQKATTDFGGRKWVAWFAPEIPLFYGPYKFYGLPGLILEVSDTNQNYKFSFKGNMNLKDQQNTSLYLETLNGQKPIDIFSEKQKQKLKIDYYLNPLKDFQEGMIVENDKGEKVEINVKKLTEQHQKNLLKYNNPIELDKAIQYPK